MKTKKKLTKNEQINKKVKEAILKSNYTLVSEHETGMIPDTKRFLIKDVLTENNEPIFAVVDWDGTLYIGWADEIKEIIHSEMDTWQVSNGDSFMTLYNSFDPVFGKVSAKPYCGAE